MEKADKATALFIGSQHMMEPAFHEAAARLEVLHIAQWDRGLKVIEERAPRLVVVSGTGDQRDPLIFVGRLRERIPHCRVPTIAAQLVGQERGLILERWDPEKDVFVTQKSPVEQLDRIIHGVLQPAATVEELRPLSDVGFYDNRPVDQRALHVQTEVMVRKEILVKSSVMEGGRILYGTSQLLPLDIADVAQGTAFIQAQHAAVLALVDKRQF